MQYSIPDKFITTIDGFGGTGKDELAVNLTANNVFLLYDPFILNQGDLVRAAAFNLDHKKISVEKNYNTQIILQEMRTLDFHSINRKELFSSENGKKAAKLVTIPGFIDALVENTAMTLRNAESPVCLLLGRICGNFFDAQVKLYLEASMETCAHRRALELEAQGETYDSAYRALVKRNEDDKRNLGDLMLPAKDAFILDAEPLPEIVYQQAEKIIKPAFEKWILR